LRFSTTIEHCGSDRALQLETENSVNSEAQIDNDWHEGKKAIIIARLLETKS